MVGFIQRICVDAGATPRPSIASLAMVHTNVCEQAPSSREIVEPPDIDVWTFPVDAKGDHELILAVQREVCGLPARPYRQMPTSSSKKAA